MISINFVVADIPTVSYKAQDGEHMDRSIKYKKSRTFAGTCCCHFLITIFIDIDDGYMLITIIDGSLQIACGDNIFTTRLCIAKSNRTRSIDGKRVLFCSVRKCLKWHDGSHAYEAMDQQPNQIGEIHFRPHTFLILSNNAWRSPSPLCPPLTASVIMATLFFSCSMRTLISPFASYFF